MSQAAGATWLTQVLVIEMEGLEVMRGKRKRRGKLHPQLLPLLQGTCGPGPHQDERSKCAGRVALCAGGRRNEEASKLGH